MDSKKKMIIAISSCVLVVMAAVVAIVAVLAAQQVTVNNSLKVTYTVQDVVCDVEVYAVKVKTSATSVTWGTAKGSAQFDINTADKASESLSLGEFTNIAKDEVVVLKFVFNNNADSAFKATLASPTAGTNFKIYYATADGTGTSGVLGSTTEFGTGKEVSVAAGDSSSGVLYARVQIDNVTKSATLNTSFNWTITKV